jgi:aryl-alcohol dehydrogenase-like predicted oxidoreductase
MNFVRLGNSGLKITELTFGSALTIGTEGHDVEYAENLVDKAWKLGIRSFDTSNNYGYGEAEILFGKALKKYPRHQYVLATKGSWPIGDSVYEKGLSRKHILWSIEESFKRLDVEYVDLYYAHRYDPEVPVIEVVRTFNYLISIGKIRYWGTSEWPLDALEECLRICDEFKLERPITEQFIYSYALQKSVNNGVDTFCKNNSLGTLGFSPLCQGFLTGKYRHGVPSDSRIAKSKQLNYDKTINFYNQNKERIDHFNSVCENYQIDYTAVALQWCIRQNIYPVFGASKVEQLEHNVESLNVEIPDAVWSDLISIL